MKNLVPVWSFSTGVDSGHESPPIVNNGVMFVTTPYSQVIALDAATGDLLWRYKRPLPEGFSALHNTNRGVALYGDKVYFAPLDAMLVALDAKTGKVAWEAKIEDWKQGYYTTMAPLIVKGKVLVGVAGGEFGVRGFVQAFDAQTGKSAWKTYTIPAPGEPGSDTWKKADTWKTGGASTWMTGNYDPDTNTVYWGTGNASPWFGDQRPGDNLYTSSTVALDGDTGKIKGHFQYHQNESWDWDEMNAPMLVDFQKNGATTKGLLKPARNGYLYWLKRDTDGSIAYLRSQGFVPQNVFTSIDKETGRPEVDMAHKPATGKSAQFCPGLWGGKDWPYEAYNPKTGLVYIPSNENHCNTLEGKVEERVPGQWWTGVAIPQAGAELRGLAGARLVRQVDIRTAGLRIDALEDVLRNIALRVEIRDAAVAVALQPVEIAVPLRCEQALVLTPSFWKSTSIGAFIASQSQDSFWWYWKCPLILPVSPSSATVEDV